MELYGKEYGFRLTVGAAAEIAELCPGKDIAQIGELIRNMAGLLNPDKIKIIVALSRGYESARKFEDPAYTKKELTAELLESLDLVTYGKCYGEAMNALVDGLKITVQTEPAKKNEDAADKASP